MPATPFVHNQIVPFSFPTLRKLIISPRQRRGGILRSYARGDCSHLFRETAFVRWLLSWNARWSHQDREQSRNAHDPGDDMKRASIRTSCLANVCDEQRPNRTGKTPSR